MQPWHVTVCVNPNNAYGTEWSFIHPTRHFWHCQGKNKQVPNMTPQISETEGFLLWKPSCVTAGRTHATGEAAWCCSLTLAQHLPGQFLETKDEILSCKSSYSCRKFIVFIQTLCFLSMQVSQRNPRLGKATSWACFSSLSCPVP